MRDKDTSKGLNQEDAAENLLRPEMAAISIGFLDFVSAPQLKPCFLAKTHDIIAISGLATKF